MPQLGRCRGEKERVKWGYQWVEKDIEEEREGMPVHNNNNNCILFAFIISFAYSLARNWQSFGCRPLKSKEGEGYPTDNSELPLTLRPSWIEIENRIIYYYPFIFFLNLKSLSAALGFGIHDSRYNFFFKTIQFLATEFEFEI